LAFTFSPPGFALGGFFIYILFTNARGKGIFTAEVKNPGNIFYFE